MHIAIMQPYFFPYLGYFSLIKNTDFFILLDEVQFMRHGWIERNRILKPQNGTQYIQVPLEKHLFNTKIKDIKIKNNEDWKNKILAQLTHYKKKAPFYYETIKLVQHAFLFTTDNITQWNAHCLKIICDYLNIHLNMFVFSNMNLDIEEPQQPDEWALNICKSLRGGGYNINIKEYINPEGGIDFFDKNKYKKENIKLRFLKHHLPFYSQRRGVENFEKGLSIIDVLMFNEKEAVLKMIDDFEFLN